MLVRGIKWVGRGLLRLGMAGLKRGPHITRFYMYDHLARVLKDRPPGGKVLSVSHSRPLCSVLGIDGLEIVDANYPDHDILDLSFPDNHFDFVVSDCVLEHVEGDPKRAFDETYRVLKPGGIAVHTTVFVHPVHLDPKDLWRFSPEGLNVMCRQFGQILDCAGWGNQYVWAYTWLGARFEGIPLAKWHPIHKLATYNQAAWPIVTWIVARK